MGETLVSLLRSFGAVDLRGPVISRKSAQLDVDKPTKPSFKLPKACVRIKNALW